MTDLSINRLQRPTTVSAYPAGVAKIEGNFGRKVHFSKYIPSELRFLWLGLVALFTMVMRQCYLIKGNQQKARELKNKIVHLEFAQQHCYYKVTKGKSYLAAARNIAKMDVFGSMKGEYQEKINAIGEEVYAFQKKQPMGAESFSDWIGKIKSDGATTTNGVCWGACFDFASKIIPLMQQFPSEEEAGAFREGLITLAKDYEDGIGPEGVSYQLAYRYWGGQVPKHSMKADGLLEYFHKAGVINTKQQVIASLLLRKFFGEEDDLPKNADQQKVQTLIQLAYGKKEAKVFEELWQNVEKQVDKGFALFDANALSPEFAEIGAILSGFVLHFSLTVSKLTEESQLSTSLKGRVKRVEQQKEQIEKRAAKLTEKVFKQAGVPLAATKNTGLNNVIKLLAQHHGLMCDTVAKTHIAALKQLKFTPTIDRLGLSGVKNDRQFLKQLEKLGNGVYNFSFRTAKGSHATLLIKWHDETYFWDPNKGLFDCSAIPEFKILQILREYSTPKWSPSNHQIWVTEIAPKS